MYRLMEVATSVSTLNPKSDNSQQAMREECSFITESSDL
jgi:hypothetical protein